MPRADLPLQNLIEREMKVALGPMLDVLLQGVQSRVNAGEFGNWGVGRGELNGGFGLTGISLLPPAEQPKLVMAARNQRMDVLLVCHVERKESTQNQKTSSTMLTLSTS